jgi:hypothetical protein
VKLKSPGKRSIRTLMVTGMALVSVSGLALSQTQALADPGTTYVAVGSDTTQDVINGWAASLSPGQLGSYNATNPTSNTFHEVITPGKAGNSTANGGPTNALAAEQCNFNRPNGSGEGNTALRASLVGTTSGQATSTSTASPIAGEPISLTSGSTTLTGNLPSNLPQQNCIDIGRSSSGVAAANLDAAAGDLLYLPFAVDGVTVSMGSTAATAPTATTAGTSTVPAGCNNAAGATTNACVATPATNLNSATGVVPGFTLAQLSAMYNTGTPETATNGVTYAPFGVPGSPVPAGDTPVDLYIPQSGSGTLKFWASQLTFSATTPPVWDFQTIQPDTGSTATGGTGTVASFVPTSQGGTAANPVGVEEHDGTAVTVDPNGLFPFSIAQFIAQHNGHNPRFHQAQILSVNGVAPTASNKLNLSFPIQLLREVYNIVAYDRVVNTGDGNFDPALAALLTSTSTSTSLFCAQKILINSYGFATITPTAPSPAGLGGEAGNHFCGQVDATNERAYGPTTGF